MNFETSTEMYYEKVENIKKIINSVIDSNISIYPSKKCVTVCFLFRGECDYSLDIPLLYCDTTHLLKDYYNRFKEYVKDEHCLATYDSKAEDFYNNEMKKLTGK